MLLWGQQLPPREIRTAAKRNSAIWTFSFSGWFYYFQRSLTIFQWGRISCLWLYLLFSAGIPHGAPTLTLLDKLTTGLSSCSGHSCRNSISATNKKIMFLEFYQALSFLLQENNLLCFDPACLSFHLLYFRVCWNLPDYWLEDKVMMLSKQKCPCSCTTLLGAGTWWGRAAQGARPLPPHLTFSWQLPLIFHL